MDPSLLYLLALLALVVGLNWRLIAARFGRPAKPCAWSRIPERDREGRKAWFCPACRREELTTGRRPPDCAAARSRD